MTEGTTATVDLKELFAKEELTLANYRRFRELALATEGNARTLEELATGLDASSKKSATKKGIALWLLGRTRPALEALERAHPEDETAAIFLGRAHLDAEDYKKAKQRFKEGVQAHKDSRPLVAGLIFSMLNLGEIDDAKEVLDKSAKLFGDDAELHFLKGFYAELTGDYEEARKQFEKTLDQDPDHVRCLFRLGRWHSYWGEESKAVELYERCRKHEPAHANVLVNLGNIYEDRADYERATDCYREVLQKTGSHARARMFLKDAEASKTMFYDEDLERRADRRSMILKIPVTDFELSVRSRNCLNKMNVKTLGDLIQMTEAELLAHKNFGETSLMEVKQMLAQKGLRLGMGKLDVGALMAGADTKQSIPEEVLKKPVADLELSVRSRKCMERLNIETLGDLIEKTEAELLAAKNFGQTSLNEIKQRLAENGLRLKEAAY